MAVNPNNYVISPQVLHWLNSGELVVMVLLGGMGTMLGPMLGAAIFIGGEDLLSAYVSQWRLVIGTLFVLFVIFVPRGMISLPTLLYEQINANVEKQSRKDSSNVMENKYD